MIVSVFDDDTRLTIHLCELACDEPDDAMFEIVCIVEQYRQARINMRKCLFELCLGGSLASCVEVFEFREESVCTFVTGQEPTECCDGCIHATGSIDTWSYLESYQIGIILSYPISSCKESLESTRTRLLHLAESESCDDAILSYDGHAVRDGSE